MRTPISLPQLKAFSLVVSQGSFSAAAKLLDLSQPAVSLQVRQLERWLGLRLVERVGRQVRPTAAGEELMDHARRIEMTVSAAVEAMQRHAAGTVGRVRLGTGATACIYFLPPLLRALRSAFPSLDIIVSTGSTADVLKALEENTIDVGLVTLPAPGRMFEVKPVLEDEMVAIGLANAAPLPRTVAPFDLATLPVVLYEPGAHTRLLIDQWASRAGILLKPVMELGSIEAIKELVGAGLGCAIVPRMAVKQTKTPRNLVIRDLDPPLRRKLAIVMRRDKPLNRGLRELVAAIKKRAAEGAL